MSMDIARDLAEAKALAADAYRQAAGPAREMLRADYILYGRALEEIEMMRACIRKLCPEIEARKLLNFAAAEAIFSEPRRDH